MSAQSIQDLLDSSVAPQDGATPPAHADHIQGMLDDALQPDKKTDDAVPSWNPSPPTASERFWHGVDMPLNAVAQMLAHAVPENTTNFIRSNLPSLGLSSDLLPTASQLDKQISDSETAYQAGLKAEGKSGPDWLGLAGNIVGTAPVMAALPFAAPETLSGAMASGAGTGALTGTLTPVTDTNGGSFAGQKTMQGLIGAGTGFALSPLTFGLGRLISPKPSEDIAMLQSKGVAPTLGQLAGGWGDTLEQKLSGVLPGFGDMIKSARGRAVGDFNEAIYNEALSPIGESFNGNAGEEAAVGHEGVKQVGDKLSAAYNNLLPNLTFKADPTFQAELQNVKSMIPYAAPDKQETMNKIIENEVESRLGPNGMMDGQSYKRMESELGQQIAKFSSDPSGDSQDVGRALKAVLSSARDNLLRSNPDQSADLSAINKGWAVLARTEKAASSTGAKDGIFSPAQFSAAVKWGDKSVRDRATARGEAFMQPLAEAGKNVLGNSVPDSGTAGRVAAGMGVAALLGGEGGNIMEHVAEHPIAAGSMIAGGALAGLPYTPWGQRAASSLLSQRSGKVLPGLAAAVQGAAPALQAGSVYSLTGGQ